MTRYEIVPEQSTLLMNVQTNAFPLRLVTHDISGWIEAEVDEHGRLTETVVATGEVEFAAASLTSGNAIDLELHRRIEAKRHPTITARLLGIERAGPEGAYRLQGVITFRGRQYPYGGDVTLTPEGADGIRFDAESTFDMRYFDVDPPKVLLFKVAPEVHSEVDVLARRAASR